MVLEAPVDFTSKKIARDTTKDANTVMLPINPPTDFGIVLQPIPFIRNPIKGKSGIRYTKLVIVI